MATFDIPTGGAASFEKRKPAKRVREKSFGLGGHVAFGFVLAFALIGGCGYWVSNTVISGAIIAPGLVKVVEDVKTVQHRDGGIVAEIAVRQGDTVEAGQLLIRLDDAQTRAELAIINGQLGELNGRRMRLVAERDGSTELVFPDTFDAADPALADLIAGESKLFAGNLLNRTRLKAQLELQQQQLDQELAGLQSQLDSLNDEISLVSSEHRNLVLLKENGLIEGSRVAASSRDLTRMEGQLGEISASMARTQSRMGEVALQILAVDETARNDAQRELRQLDALLAELEERGIAIEDRLSRTDIRAPTAGTVNELHVTTIGGIVTPAETLVTIVPADAELQVEVRLRTIDVDQITVGGPARLRFSAFNSRTTPEVKGAVRRVSAAAQRDPATGETYYLADISFDRNELADSLDLRPGMPVEAFVETAQMTPLAYLAKPFTDQIARAFREE
ncbi:HlyD family type I secretion periplasmic adaptor subunit [Devosia sp. ZB163]|uniref:HlyD family type I secretion periplasmic adaptor subunit n=1 Tax=Devosia sp. ZB163 TaxID=3025938 RepID=UPI00235F5C15|nr:HlyD family type I secretion periplasmic adaptor subunit [Devosia sp. ZB163]MDC9825130.1 HlyD family type I secretion periplasmic adaptor subunit [Devosia sp. ZB163]